MSQQVMGLHKMRLELLKLARGQEALPAEPSQVIEAARQFEEFVFKSRGRESPNTV